MCGRSAVDALADPEAEIVYEMEGAVTRTVRKVGLWGLWVDTT
jgi:hypothetical protein